MMNIDTLEWDRPILEALEIDADILPEIHSSSEVFGTIRDGSILDGIQITGVSIFANWLSMQQHLTRFE